MITSDEGGALLGSAHPATKENFRKNIKLKVRKSEECVQIRRKREILILTSGYISKRETRSEK